MNIDSELARAESLLQKNDQLHSQTALERALDLLDLSIEVQDHAAVGRLKEFMRLRDIIADQYVQAHEYELTLTAIRKWFQPFAYRVALERYGK